MSKMLIPTKKLLEKYSNQFSILRYVPFSLRLGRVYREHRKLIAWHENASKKEKRDFYYINLKSILDYAFNNIPFYKEFYSSKNYNPVSFKKLEDFAEVPILNKEILKEYSLDNRSNDMKGSIISNTGGTSGNPLDFRLDKHCFHREWAYMHKIWASLNYSYLDTKLTFRGRNIGSAPLKYNVVHNEYIVNAYLGLDKVIDSIILLTQNRDISYLHGYPSSIYEFCRFMQSNDLSSRHIFKDKLKGVFFGSEYPAPHYRSLIEKTLKVPTLSWYGHSEFAILASETSPFIYKPQQTYGFSEAVKCIDKHEYSLIGTGYYNQSSPFIRYDTGDLIRPLSENDGILESFEITEGRIGDFIVDANGARISLTALIFGRHHEAFRKADFIQVRSHSPGKAALVVTGCDISLADFDLTNTAVDFNLEIVSKPFKTISGKLPLLIR